MTEKLKGIVQNWILLMRILQTGKSTTREIAKALVTFDALQVGTTPANVISMLQGIEKLGLVSKRTEVVKLQHRGTSVFYFWTLTYQGEELLGNLQAVFAGKYNPNPSCKIGVDLKGSPRLILGVSRLVILAALLHGVASRNRLRDVLAQVCVTVMNNSELHRCYLKPLVEQGYLVVTTDAVSLTALGGKHASFLRSALGMDDEDNYDFKWQPMQEVCSLPELPVALPAAKESTPKVIEVATEVAPRNNKLSASQLMSAVANYTAMGLLQPLLLVLVAAKGTTLNAFAEKIYPRESDSFGKIREKADYLQKLGYLDSKCELTDGGFRLLEILSLAVAPQLIAIPQVATFDEQLRRAIRRLVILKLIDLSYDQRQVPQLIERLFKNAEEGQKARESIKLMYGGHGMGWLTNDPVTVSLVGKGILSFWRSLLPIEDIVSTKFSIIAVEDIAVEPSAEEARSRENEVREDICSLQGEPVDELTPQDIEKAFLSI